MNQGIDTTSIILITISIIAIFTFIIKIIIDVTDIYIIEHRDVQYEYSIEKIIVKIITISIIQSIISILVFMMIIKDHI